MYGVGLSAAEAPMLNDPSENIPLQDGMVIFVAPRISRNGFTPLSCGDLYQVKEGGAVRLGNLPRELIVV